MHPFAAHNALALPLLLLVPLGCISSNSGTRFTETIDPADLPCVPSGDSNSGTLQSSGVLEGAQHFDCDMPAPDSDAAPIFTAWSGTSSVVNGGSLELMLDWEGADSLDGRLVVFALSSEVGFMLVRLDELSNPAPIELFFSQEAVGGNFTLFVGLDDGTGTEEGPAVIDEVTGDLLGRPPVVHVRRYLEIPIDVIRVQGGDIQVSINWDSDTDVDLYVVDPLGAEIYYGAITSPSGGTLDLDSNASCSSGPRNENIFWPTGGAPAGDYQVRANYWSSCNYAGRTTYRVTIVLGGDQTYVHSGDFEAAEATGGGAGAGEEVTTFSWGG